MSYAKNTQSRKWTIVINNPEDHGFTIDVILELLYQFNPDYFCLAAEISSTGTYHIHIFLFSTSAMRFGTVKGRFPTAHIEMARGSCFENREYIRKGGKWTDTEKADTRVEGSFKEFGTLPNESEEKNPKMAQLIQYIKDGLTNLEIIEIDHSYGFKTREIDLLRQQLLEEKYTKDNRDVIVHYIHGDSGTGKTRSIFDKHPATDICRITNYPAKGNVQFDAYKGQNVLVFEEFHSQISISDMLNYLDIYPVMLPARYYDRVACYTTVYITSNIPLEQQYPEIQKCKLETWNAFLRRIHTVNSFFDTYIETKYELKQSTRTNYKYMYKKYVSEDIGLRSIASIKYSDIKRFYIHLIKDLGFKPNSMEIIHTILHPIFMMAVRDGLIRTNPTNGVMAEIKKSHDWEKGKRHALTIPQQTAFINYIAECRTYKHWLPMFTVLLGTGGRVGEVLGLRWVDCDFESNLISINHNLIYRQQDNGKCEFHVTTPKSDSGIRIVPMLSEVKDALLSERERQEREGFNQTVIDGFSGFVFKNRYGGCFNAHMVNRAIDCILRDYNKEETAKAEQEHREPELLPHFSVHNLRHTFCTRFCENETNLKVIQEIMGHADISTTMNIYNEATREKKQESFANLEGKIKIS